MQALVEAEFLSSPSDEGLVGSEWEKTGTLLHQPMIEVVSHPRNLLNFVPFSGTAGHHGRLLASENRGCVLTWEKDEMDDRASAWKAMAWLVMEESRESVELQEGVALPWW